MLTAPLIVTPNPSTLPGLVPEPAIIRDLSYYSLPARGEGEFLLSTDSGSVRIILDNRPVSIPATPVRAPIAEHIIPAESQVQEGNSCGPTSAVIALTALGDPVPVDEIAARAGYHTIFGTSPFGLRDAVAERGFSAAILDRSGWDEIVSFLDRGIFCIAIVQSGQGLHYETISGYRIFDNGVKQFQITNTDGNQYFLSLERFDEEWRSPAFRGIGTGFSRAIIAIGRAAELPSERISARAAFLSSSHQAVNSSLNMVGAIASALGKVASDGLTNGGLFVMLGHLISTSTQALGGVFSAASRALSRLRHRLRPSKPTPSEILFVVEGDTQRDRAAA